MTTRTYLLTTFALATPLVLAQAQTVQTTSSSPSSSIERTIQDIKNPVPWLSWGGDLRIRNEYFDNTIMLNPHAPLHEQDYFRFRARVWASLLPTNDFTINVRLADEARDWLKPAGYSPMKGHIGPDWAEGVVDNLNVRWRNILGQPAAITVGRQDLLLGDGWLVGDGTPFDGSWTYYLDAARATYELKDQHTIIDAIGILQDAHDNGWLPPIADETQRRFLTEQNEKGAILNIANSSVKEANLTGYFIYKHDSVAGGPGDPRSREEAAKPSGGDEADIYTLGGRLNGLLCGDHWKYGVEGAYQFGQKRDPAITHDDAYLADHAVAKEFRDINAFGANTRLTYLFNDKLNNQLTLSYEFLSGDDPRTKSDEMFDALWGRWPRWSEIGLYSFARETRIGQEANMHRVGPTWSLTPVKNLDFSASYWALFAQQDVATRVAQAPADPVIAGTGDFRGHFVQAVLKYKFSQHLSGHLWAEYQFPGDYYVHHQIMSFLRAELYLTF